MPDPPHVGLITRYLFESPYLPVGMLAVAAVVVGWTSFREGRIRGQQVAAALGLLAAVVVITAAAVTTSGEHARRVTLEFVDSTITDFAPFPQCCLQATIGLPHGRVDPLLNLVRETMLEIKQPFGVKVTIVVNA